MKIKYFKYSHAAVNSTLIMNEDNPVIYTVKLITIILTPVMLKDNPFPRTYSVYCLGVTFHEI